jgi:protein gp37
MSDMFHERTETEWRDAAYRTIGACPQHTFILLTKRPEIAERDILGKYSCPRLFPNVWLGVTVENQARADERIPILLRIPAAVRFVSVEPMLGPVDLREYLPNLDWVIAGPETGAGARQCNPAWIADIAAQCEQAGVAFHDKREGAHCIRREWPCTAEETQP